MASLAQNLSQYLLALHHYEQLAERHRRKIAVNAYFQPETTFERMDKFRKGYLVPDDLAEFMLENQLYPSETELYLIFRDFDNQRAGVVTLQQLTTQLLPKEDSQLHKKAIQRKYYPSGPRLEIDLQYQIAKYFEHKLIQIKQLALIRTHLLKHSHMVEAAFGLLDYRKLGYLSSLNELDQFLRANGKLMSQAELCRIFRVLNFDQGPCVTYECFRENLDPFAKGYYIGYSQRIAEKHMIQRSYLRQKIELNNSLVQRSKERLLLSSQIASLRDSNYHLGRLIESQGQEQRAREHQLLAYRVQRGEY